MSSLFNLPTSENIADPSSATDRIVHEEVTPRSSSLDGAVTIEFTSSPQRWYSPSDSYVLIGFNVHASDGAGAFTAVDYDSAVPAIVGHLNSVFDATGNAGDAHSAVVSDGGMLFTWGTGTFGRLGLGDERDRNVPEQVAMGAETVFDVYGASSGERAA